MLNSKTSTSEPNNSIGIYEANEIIDDFSFETIENESNQINTSEFLAKAKITSESDTDNVNDTIDAFSLDEASKSSKKKHAKESSIERKVQAN